MKPKASKRKDKHADLSIGRTATGRFAPGNAIAKGNYTERLNERIWVMQNALSRLTGNGLQWAEELWGLANGKYGATPAQRIQALEIIGNRLFGKVTEQHAVALVGQGDGVERPYAALSPEALERLIRGLPAPHPAEPAADVVDGEIVTPQTPADPAAAGE